MSWRCTIFQLFSLAQLAAACADGTQAVPEPWGWCGNAWCNAPGPDFAVSPPAFSVQSDQSHPDEPFVQDRTTDLTWQGCIAGRLGADCRQIATDVPLRRPWQAAWEYCRDLRWAGRDDWALPGFHQLLSLVDYTREPASYAPMIDGRAFPGTPLHSEGAGVWTSSTDATDAAEAWSISFGDGTAVTSRKAEPRLVRCVRHKLDPAPLEHLVVTVGDEPLVEDRWTDLLWQGCPTGLSGPGCELETTVPAGINPVLWPRLLELEAERYCAELSWGGQAGWRLPSLPELASLLDDHRASPALDTNAWPASPEGGFWSASTIEINLARWGWYLDLSASGMVLLGPTDPHDKWARCVRAIP